MTQEPTRPKAWANFLGRLWGARFPVDVRQIALEYSSRYPDRIKKIQEFADFEGALFPLPKSGQWAILYNPDAPPGRINFTIGHELGHYLVHRAAESQGFQCGEKQVLGYDRDAERRRIEQEADEFASYLLMPMDDFRGQIGRAEMTLDLLAHCADRYDVSRTAAAIKWIDCTSECAVLVVATNGHVLWCWRSRSAKKRRIFLQSGMELPSQSWSARPGLIVSESRGLELPGDVWPTGTPTREMTIFADRYEMTISLLVMEDDQRGYDCEDEPVEDTFDRFMARQ